MMMSSAAVVSSQNKDKESSDDEVVDINVEEDSPSVLSNENQLVTSHLYLKPIHTTSAAKSSLDKQVILRRIRHRKRVNQLRSAVKSFLGSSSSSKPTAPHKSRWVDDPFAAP